MPGSWGEVGARLGGGELGDHNVEREMSAITRVDEVSACVVYYEGVSELGGCPEGLEVAIEEERVAVEGRNQWCRKLREWD